MVMSAKTPGLIAGQTHTSSTGRPLQQLAALPPLLVNIGPRSSLTDYDEQDYESSLLFGPGGAMFLPADSSKDAQSPQSVNQLQGLRASPSTVAATSSPVFQLQSLASDVNSDEIPQPSPTLPLSTTSVLLTDTPIQSPTSVPSSIASTQPSGDLTLTSQSQSQSQPLSESHTQAGFVTASASSATSIGVTSATTVSSIPPSLTTFQAFPSPSSTSTLQRDMQSLPRVAEIVIGVVGAISIIAFLATLGSWIYKQRHQKNDHVEITSISSFNNTPRGGFFGCLKNRSGRHIDDMSELGFGLGRVPFFNEPDTEDEHHHVGLTRGGEDAMPKDINEGKGTNDAHFSIQNPFSDYFGVDLVDFSSSTVRLPVRLHENGIVNDVSSTSISPYQHLAPASALGGSHDTPLTVANFAPGDLSSIDEGKNGATLLGSSSVMRYPSVGTPRIGVSNPRFTRLVEDGALAVPWAPLNIRRNELQSIREDQESKDLRGDEEARVQDKGFEQLQLSRSSTLSLGMSRTFSQKLDYSLSRTSDWHNGVTRPPPGTFRAAWDAQRSPEGDVTGNRSNKNWATTLRNNFYNALNAVGNSIHATNTSNKHVDAENPPENLNPATFTQDPTARSYKSHVVGTKDTLEDILTPPPAKVNPLRLRRTKGSILRGNLGIAPGGGIERGTGLGLGLESLSRSSTLSTCWSETEKESTEETTRKVRMRVRDMSRNSCLVQRSDTSSTASSISHPISRGFSISGRGRLGVSGRRMKPPSQRPRYSRMPVSQGSVWSSTSFASTNGGHIR